MRAFMGLPCPNKIAGSVADIHEAIQYVSPKISRFRTATARCCEVSGTEISTREVPKRLLSRRP